MLQITTITLVYIIACALITMLLLYLIDKQYRKRTCRYKLHVNINKCTEDEDNRCPMGTSYGQKQLETVDSLNEVDNQVSVYNALKEWSNLVNNTSKEDRWYESELFPGLRFKNISIETMGTSIHDNETEVNVVLTYDAVTRLPKSQ